MNQIACSASQLGLGPLGVALSSGTWDEMLGWDDVLAMGPQLEELGYSTIWLGGGPLTELSQVTDLVHATREVTIGTSIVAVDRFASEPVATAYTEITAAYPNRFVLGLGGAHGPTPLRTLNEYLDRLDGAVPPVPRSRRVLAALGPRMLDLARDRTAGALPVLATPEYTAQARARLGPDAALIIQQLVVLDTSPQHARDAARQPISFLLGVNPGYRTHFRRMGFTDHDITTLSDRLVNALVAWGDLDTIAHQISRHHAAGADQVALTTLPTRLTTVVIGPWRELATMIKLTG